MNYEENIRRINEEMLNNIEKYILVDGEQITLSKTQKKKLKSLFKLYSKVDANEKNYLQLHQFHSRLKEILKINHFDNHQISLKEEFYQELNIV